MSSAQRDRVQQNLDYGKLVNTPEFKALVKRKNAFLTPYVIMFFAAYFLLPYLTGFTQVLQAKVIGWITLEWVYSWGLFAMTWVFATIYVKKSFSFDKEAEAILEKNVLK